MVRLAHQPPVLLLRWAVPELAEGFLNDVDMVVVFVKHAHILENEERLKGKVVLDCCNVLHNLDKVYHI